MIQIAIILLLCLSSCLPFKEATGPLLFEEGFRVTQINDVAFQIEEEQRFLEELRKQQAIDYAALEKEAVDSFSGVKKLFERKCFDCHDSSRKLPLYGRILPRINPVKKHQDEGLEALDMVNIYPFKAKGGAQQLALLKAIKSAALDKTMPLKSYIFVYQFRRVTKKDTTKILNWVEPLIEEHERLEEKYRPLYEADTPAAKVTRVFAAKCIRCHGNGNNRGNFGGMENLEELAKRTKYIDLESPEESYLYTISLSGEMPTDPRERLNQEELDTIIDWIESLEKDQDKD